MLETDLQTATYEEIAQFSFNEGLRIEVQDIQPYVVFAFLRDVLGQPEIEFNDDEDWCWYIKISDSFLYVYGSNGKWEGRIFSPDQQKADEVSSKFVKLLKKKSSKYLKNLKGLPISGFVLQNPFKLYFNNALMLIEKAEAIKEDFSNLKAKEERSTFCQSAFFLLVAAFEGFLNLIYELYLKPALRDERIYSRLSREQVDIKVRLAPMYCLCFNTDVIDHRNEAFQKFQYIVDLRNSFIHANFTKPMRTSIVRDGKQEFELKNGPESKYGVPKNIAELEISHIHFVRQTILSMTNLLVENMKPRYKHEISPIFDELEIYVQVVDDEYIVVV